ncbi:MAG: efflux RND transporter permease subunit [SAR324 cluster bacterium]|nr:efflux RND transporter permease subunit [SAR324 cluster bacterium]
MATDAPTTNSASISDLPSISVRRPVLVVVVNLLIILAGLAALLGVEVRELPDVDRPVISVRADYPGAAPETMDAEVTARLEGAVARVAGVRSIRSSSEEANMRIFVEFEIGVDIHTAANDLREAVSEVERRLPPGVENLTVIKADDDALPIIRLSVYSESLSIEDLTRRVEAEVVAEFLSVPGVADVQIFGKRARVLNVVVDPLRLARFGLSVPDVAESLKSANLDVPAGSFPTGDQTLLVRANASVVEEEQLEQVVIRGTTRIGDVAEVFYGPKKAISRTRLNGRPVIALGIIRQAHSNIIEISQRVDHVIESLNGRMRDIEITKTSDDAIFIRGAVSQVLKTLAISIGIVILVLYLFLGSLRATLIPAITIPVALVGTLAAIWLLGFSVNLLTLLALVLATGLVVDDAIVVLENIERIRKQGVQRLAAAVLGTREVFFAVVATTTTLASVFIPIAFLPGSTGQLFTEFGFVLAIAVAISSLVALTLCPMLASRLPGHGGEEKNLAEPRWGGTRWVGAHITRAYSRSLQWAMKAPILVGGLGIIAAAAVGTLYTSLHQELVPPEDRGVLTVRLRGPEGVNLDYTDRQVRQVEQFLQPLMDSGEVTNVLSVMGWYDLSLGYTVASLAPWHERERSQLELARELRPKLYQIAGSRAGLRNPNSLNIRGADSSRVRFVLTGPEYDEIAVAGETLMAAIRQRMPHLRSVNMEYYTTQPLLSVVLDRERAADMKVDLQAVATTLRAMAEGYQVTEMNVADEIVPLVIRSAQGAVANTDDLRNLLVPTAAGRLVSLSSIMHVRESGIAAELDRHRQRRAVEIVADLAPGHSIGQVAQELRDLVAELLPKEIGFLLRGEAEAVQEASRDVAITFFLALLVVLLVLAAQFESFSSAVVVLLTVPFGLSAAVLALWLTGTSLNIYSQIGLIMLIGLMAKNAILIVEFAGQLRDRGLSVREAAHQAAVIRLRPVMMTMLSTMLGSLPLILSGGPGAEARSSIGWVIVGGLGFAILGTVYFTPLAYQLIAPLGHSRGEFGRSLEEELAQEARRRGPAHGVPPPPSGEAADG